MVRITVITVTLGWAVIILALELYERVRDHADSENEEST